MTRLAIISGLVPVLILLSLIFLALFPSGPESHCGPSVTIDPDNIPDSFDGKWDRDQLVIAATIVNAGAEENVGLHGQLIGVMTAIGESTLRNIDYGDGAGPDSRGIFQQRANGAWGSYEDRMNPRTAALNFFRALKKVPGWESMRPTIAAHKTQINADKDHYERWWPDANAIVSALSGLQLDPSHGVAGCIAVGSHLLVDTDWTYPVLGGKVGSGFGYRIHPISGIRRLHAGVDMGCAPGTKFWAVADGIVTYARWKGGYGHTTIIDHGEGVTSLYAHQIVAPPVSVGQRVSVGQLVGQCGSTGYSTGPHLHFEIRIHGAPIDPVPFLIPRGVNLRQPFYAEVAQ